METKPLIPIERIEKRCLEGGVNTLLTRESCNFYFLQVKVEFWHKFTHSQYISSKKDKSISTAESKACNLQECKGMGLECANAIGDTEIFGVVLIGGAIVHPR